MTKYIKANGNIAII